MSHAFKLKITNNYVIIMLSFYIILESECAICINFLNLHKIFYVITTMLLNPALMF